MKNQKLNLIFKIIIGAITSFLFFLCFLVLFFQLISLQENQKDNISSKCPTSKNEILYKIEDIIDSKKIFSSSISPNGLYQFLLLDNEDYRKDEHNFRNNEGAMLLVEKDLVFVNLKTGEKKEFSFEDLASEEIFRYLEKVPVTIQFIFRISFLGWDNKGENLWLRAGLVSGGDPPEIYNMFIFKINVKDLSIEKHPEFPNVVIGIYSNSNKNKFLFDSIDDPGLYLYLYDALNREKELIVFYDNISDKYPDYHSYLYPEFYGIERRRLRPEWLEEDYFCYTDFVTGVEIMKRVK